MRDKSDDTTTATTPVAAPSELPTKRCLLRWAVVATLGLTSLWLLMPPENQERVAASARRLILSKAQSCLDYTAKRLKDPDSAILLGSARDGEQITYKAKNSYGAYVTDEAKCSFNGSEVDASQTEYMRELMQSNKESKQRNIALNARIECLKRTNAYLKEGYRLDEAKAMAACRDDLPP
jgi:hypothetical protein